MGNRPNHAPAHARAESIRRRLAAWLSSLVLVATQVLGTFASCAMPTEALAAEAVGSHVEIVNAGDSGFEDQAIWTAGSGPDAPWAFCLEPGVNGQSGDSVVQDAVGATVRGWVCINDTGQDPTPDQYKQLDQNKVTLLALVQDYLQNSYGDGELMGGELYVMTQRCFWELSEHDFDLDRMAACRGHHISDKAKGIVVAASDQLKARMAEGSVIGRGRFYSKPNGTQQCARFWLEPARGDLEIAKTSTRPQVSAGNGCYNLAGAEYGVFRDEGCTDRAATIVTDAGGRGKATGLLAGRYYVRETTPAPGFALDETVRAVDVPAGAVARADVADAPQTCQVDVAVVKRDAESGETPTGAATLAGAEFRIDYYAGSYDLGSLPASPQKSFTVTTADDGTARLGQELPLGTVAVQETKAPEGYLLNSQVEVRRITGEGTGVHVSTYDAPVVADAPIRGGLSFVKADEGTQGRMAGVAFKLTSQSTGESHVIVTDENGMFDSEENAHSTRTNASDSALGEDGEVTDEGKLDPAAGIWFGNGDVDDARGALPYGTYLLEELRCAANQGHRLVSTTLRVSRDARTYALGTFDDERVSIATTLSYGEDEKTCPAAEGVELTDAVEYEGLEPGHGYRVRGELHDIDEDGRDLGVVASAEGSFAPQLSSGTQELRFVLDASQLGGHRLVAFERVYDGDDLLAEHADPDDEGQSVRVPRIATTLTGNAGHEADASAQSVKLTDTVAYRNLEPGNEYLLQGTLHVKGDDGSDLGAATDDAGEPICAQVAFTPDVRDGFAEVVFEFTGVALAGKDVVAFESLERNGIQYAVHADIEDEGQTVDFPRLRTTATAALTDDHITPRSASQHIVDVVEHENLVPGAEYELAGEVHLRGEDGSDEGVVAQQRATFVPEGPDGSQELEFEVDASGLGARTLVVFEELYRAGERVGSHADIDDEGQSVRVPDLGTELLSDNGKKELDWREVGQETTLVDTVTYRNLICDKVYRVEGALHLKDENGEDAGVLKASDGSLVTASAEFTADAADGTATVEFRFKAPDLAGKQLVAFESLYSEDVLLAVHADIEDEAQTVTFGQPPTSNPPAEPREPSAPGVPKTGDVSLPVIACCILGGLLTFTAWAIVRAGSMYEEDEL